MSRRAPPLPPRPELERRPRGPFGWLDAELLHEGRLAEIGPNAAATLVLLALAADRRGASYFSRDRMAVVVGISRYQLDAALLRLRDCGLVDHRPWKPGATDGVWQLLPLPARRPPERALRQLSAADVLRSLGFEPR